MRKRQTLKLTESKGHSLPTVWHEIGVHLTMSDPLGSCGQVRAVMHRYQHPPKHKTHVQRGLWDACRCLGRKFQEQRRSTSSPRHDIKWDGSGRWMRSEAKFPGRSKLAKRWWEPGTKALLGVWERPHPPEVLVALRTDNSVPGKWELTSLRKKETLKNFKTHLA